MKLLQSIRGALFGRWGRAPLRDHLALTILVALLPMALLTSYLLLQEARDRAARLKESLEQVAETTAHSVDRELLASVDALTILARSEVLLRPDAGAIRSELLEAKELGRSWRGLFVLDRDGKPLVDTQEDQNAVASSSRRFKDRLPDRTYWLISDPDDSGTGSAFAIVVPIRDHAELRGFLGAHVDIAALLQVLESVGPPPGYTYALVDSAHRVIVQTGPADGSVGKPVDARAVEAMQESISGVTEVSTAEREPDFVGWRALGTSGWTVTVSAPKTVIESAFYSALYSALIMGGTSLLLGMVLAAPLAQRIIRPLRALALRGAAGLPEGSSIQEIQQLRDGLAGAAEATRMSYQRVQALADEFRALFETAPIGLAFAEDTECKVIRTNEAFDRMMNVSGSLPGRVFESSRLLDRAHFPLCRAAAEGTSVRDLELEIETDAAAGTKIVVLASALPLLDENGRVRGAIGAMVDITGRKLVESRLAASDRAVRQTQMLIDLAQEAASVGFFHYRFDTDVAIWSHGHAQLFDVRAGSFDGALGKWLDAMLPEDRVTVAAQLRESQREERSKIVVDYRVVSQGTVRWVSTRLSATYAPDGTPVEMTGVSFDVTELKAAELARIALAEQEQAARLAAEAANRAKDHFLGMLGHELRNPLGALTTAVAVLQRVDRNGKVALDAEAIIARQTDHLRRLIDDLLDVARIVSGKVVLERQPLNLAELVRRGAASAQTQPNGGQKVMLDVDDVWIYGDWVRIEQILNNLLGNAFKHSRLGDSIRVVTRRDGPAAFLEVIDNGPGIPPDLLSSVFEPFVQGDRTIDRRMGGLGIGLTVVRQLAQLHGGSVTAASSPAGTTMSVQFNAIEPTTAMKAPGTERPTAAATPRTVVVVEDNEDAREALRTMLELEGHTVHVAEDGARGLELLLKDRPDVAIVDIGLPGMNGIDIAWELRAAGYEGKLIAVSGYGQDKDRASTSDAGFDAHLVKPVSLPELARLIEKA